MAYLRKGDTGPQVAELQMLLNEAGASPQLYPDGIFGSGTEAAVMAFQSSRGLVADGIVGPATYEELLKVTGGEPPTNNPHPDVIDEVYLLSSSEYQTYPLINVVGSTSHHTVSNGNPKKVVDAWEHDNRGAATQLIIGRTEDNGSTEWNGKIIQCMPWNAWGYHMETRRVGFDADHNRNANRFYFAIEICAWGCLTFKDGKFYNAIGGEVAPSEVCTLDRPFRTFLHWHRYTDEQLHAWWKAHKLIGEKFNIDWTDLSNEPEVVNADWLEMDWKALYFMRQLTTHTNFEWGKYDCFPQPEFLEAIRSVYQGSPHV